MLTLPRTRAGPAVAVSAAIAMVTAAVAVSAPPAVADTTNVCIHDPENAGGRVCYTVIQETMPDGSVRPKLELTRGGGGHQKWCVRREQDADLSVGPWRVECDNAEYGWFSLEDDCYFDADIEEQPAAGMPGWEEHGSDGVVYLAHCYPPSSYDFAKEHWNGSAGLWQGSDYVIFADRPPGYGGTPRVVPGLIVEAFDGLGLRGPHIAAAPPTSTAGLVRLQSWLWIETSAQTWGPTDYTVSAGGWQVRAEAEGQQVVWNPGDGSEPVTCPGPGTKWLPRHGSQDSECGHTYLHPSRDQPGASFPLTATVQWQVTWTLNGQPAMSTEVEASSTVPYRVNEIQVLVTHP